MALSNQIDALEQRLTELLGVMENLAAENRTLKTREQTLQNECISLQKKNAAAGRQLETILERLKQLDNHQSG